ncbi:MAG: cysteine peptidase family C39 domain-containing protein, partial [Nodularia sp. (in: cyanobacteria)]|nr:cysteine peptidase family C39 domain-containing protein [Nodularia sp. (in: cyanobacteria)]
MTIVFDQQNLSKKLTDTLGETLTKRELQNCLASVEVVEPPTAKHFWQSAKTNPGIYIILGGKVRVLDIYDNLITTLSASSSFGEMTLFPEENFSHYTARASTNLELGYLRQEVLQGFMDKYPQIRDRLFSHAEIWDLMLLSRQNSQFPGHTAQVPGMLKALSLFERHDLEPGTVSREFPNSQLWLLYKGKIDNSANESLTPGSISPAPKPGDWQVIQPTIAYILNQANWQTALEHCQELGSFVPQREQTTIETGKKIRSSPSRKPRQKSIAKVIPFPQRESEVPPQKKNTLPYFPTPKVRMGHWWQYLSKRYPFYAQQSASDCGCACLVMIGNYWGKRLSVNRLREMTNVSRSGASLRAIASAAENL